MIALTRRRSSAFQLLTIGTLFVFMWAFLLPHESIAKKEVRIPAGTVVVLKTTTTLTPVQLRVGDTVDLLVVSDVVVDGEVVIEAGAKARGEITTSRERNFIGIAGKLGLAVRSVQAVDGTTVLMSGTKLSEGKNKMVVSIGLSLVCCILFALMKGGHAYLQSGTQIEATLPATATIAI
jgi:hypothetical protein